MSSGGLNPVVWVILRQTIKMANKFRKSEDTNRVRFAHCAEAILTMLLEQLRVAVLYRFRQST